MKFSVEATLGGTNPENFVTESFIGNADASKFPDQKPGRRIFGDDP
jgi:hypothetical protein